MLINEQRDHGIVYKCPPGHYDDLGVSLACWPGLASTSI